MILGIAFMAWGITIYRITLIDTLTPLFIALSIGTLAFLIDKDQYSSTYDTVWVNLFAWFQNTLSWGFIACTLFLFTNKFLANSDSSIRDYKIDNITTMVGYPRAKSNEKPLIRIDYDGKIRELVFSSKYLNELNNYRTVTLITKSGFWGYEIIVEQELNK